jgi:hypothetical protein
MRTHRQGVAAALIAVTSRFVITGCGTGRTDTQGVSSTSLPAYITEPSRTNKN